MFDQKKYEAAHQELVAAALQVVGVIACNFPPAPDPDSEFVRDGGYYKENPSLGALHQRIEFLHVAFDRLAHALVQDQATFC